jgi:hypothetical protein
MRQLIAALFLSTLVIVSVTSTALAAPCCTGSAGNWETDGCQIHLQQWPWASHQVWVSSVGSCCYGGTSDWGMAVWTCEYNLLAGLGPGCACIEITCTNCDIDFVDADEYCEGDPCVPGGSVRVLYTRE